MGRRATTSHGNQAASAPGFTLDAGALIALERSNRALRALIDQMLRTGGSIAVPAGALAQAWRGSPRQHQLWILLGGKDVETPPLDVRQALAAGVMLAARGGSDVVDASVVLTARERRHWVVTSDAEDLRQLDPDLPIVEV